MEIQMEYQQLREKYISLFAEEGVLPSVLGDIESALGVQLPRDLREIASFYHGGIIGGISHNELAVAGPADNVVESTLRLREAIALPQKFVVLAEPPNSLIVLDTDPKAAAVTWCDAQDVAHLSTSSFASAPDTWTTYAEFFSYLVEEEEDER